MEGAIESAQPVTDWHAGAIALCGYDGASASPEDPNKAGQCIKPSDGPVYFSGGGYDQVIGLGAGIEHSKFSIPSIGAQGTATTGGGYIGFGASLGGGGGKVNNFGNFNGSGYRFVAETPIPYVGGEALWGNDMQRRAEGLVAAWGEASILVERKQK